jgi:hypothetical protein
MRVAVAVVPRLLVAIVAAGRDEAIEHLGDVAAQTGFELDGSNRRWLPMLKTLTVPLRIPEDATIARTLSVRSCVSPWDFV